MASESVQTDAVSTSGTRSGAASADSELLDKFMSVPLCYGGEVSPDGKYVSWTLSHAGPVMNVFFAPCDGSAEPVQLSHESENTFDYGWTPDSKAVIVGQDKGGDERIQLFKIAIDAPGKLVALTEANPKYYIDGGRMHPNMHWLVYGANYDFEKKKELEETWLYRHDLESAERKVIAKALKGGSIGPELNKQGNQILYSRNDLHPGGKQVWLVNIDGTNDREILNIGADKKITAHWLSDGQRILFHAETGPYNKVGLFDTRDNKISWIIDDPKRNIESISAPERSDRAIIIEFEKARPVSSFLDLSDPQHPKETPVKPVKNLTVSPIDLAENNKWVCISSNSTKPGELFLYDAEKNSLSENSITNLKARSSLDLGILARAEDFDWTSTDGTKMHGWIYRVKDPKNLKGTIVVVHGGPTGHDEDEFDVQVQYFVASGFNVFTPNYRGSTGYGLPFQESIKKDGWGGKEQEDISSGIEALIKAGIAQPGKIGMTGTSYGGYSSWWAITHFPSSLVAAAAPICGMTDLVVDYDTTRPDLRPYSAEMMGGTPTTVPDRFKERSPIHFVQNIKGKLLIVQGARDPNVTPENVRTVEIALKKANIPYEKLVFENEGHGIDRPENEHKLYLRLVDFFTTAFAPGS